ncbi:MAG: type II toxin-antitoxin system VapC family toxin [Myxococcota bacterium]
MRYLLDTNVCVDYLTGRHAPVITRIQAVNPADMGVSSVVVAELRYGADKSKHKKRNHGLLDALLKELRCLDFSASTARAFGRIRAALEQRGESIGPYDTMIAAHALDLGCVLVTDNVKEFKRVKGLRVENWRH